MIKKRINGRLRKENMEKKPEIAQLPQPSKIDKIIKIVSKIYSLHKKR